MKRITFLLLVGILVALHFDNAKASSPYVDSFPSPSSTRFTQLGSRFWNLGDFVEEVFTGTGLTTIDEFSLDLLITPNALVSDTQDMDVLLNGTVIGSFMISSVDSSVELDFTGLSISGTGPSDDDYLLRIETTRTVNSGSGSAGILNGVQNLTLAQIPEPSTLALVTLSLVGMSFRWRARDPRRS